MSLSSTQEEPGIAILGSPYTVSKACGCKLMLDPTIWCWILQPLAFHIWHGRRHDCVHHTLDPIMPVPKCLDDPFVTVGWLPMWEMITGIRLLDFAGSRLKLERTFHLGLRCDLLALDWSRFYVGVVLGWRWMWVFWAWQGIAYAGQAGQGRMLFVNWVIFPHFSSCLHGSGTFFFLSFLYSLHFLASVTFLFSCGRYWVGCAHVPNGTKELLRCLTGLLVSQWNWSPTIFKVIAMKEFSSRPDLQGLLGVFCLLLECGLWSIFACLDVTYQIPCYCRLPSHWWCLCLLCCPPVAYRRFFYQS